MNEKILTIIVIGMLALLVFSGCVTEEEKPKPTPTPTPSEELSKSIPMPQDTGEGEEAPPELPI